MTKIYQRMIQNLNRQFVIRQLDEGSSTAEGIAGSEVDISAP
jgi:hypothetical protein